MLNTLDTFDARWSTMASNARNELYDERTALLIERMLADVRESRSNEDNELLTIAEAARYSGFDAATLSRQVESGKLENKGTGKRTLIRRNDLPMKPAGERPLLRNDARVLTVPTQREQIARTTITPFKRGGHG